MEQEREAAAERGVKLGARWVCLLFLSATGQTDTAEIVQSGKHKNVPLGAPCTRVVLCPVPGVLRLGVPRVLVHD